MELKGRVFLVGNVEVVSEKFQKRELVLEYSENPEYIEHIKFEASQKKVELLDGIKPGDTVEAHFNLKGRGWKDKTGKQNYTNTLALWRLVKLDDEKPAMQGAYVGSNEESDSGDLPF
jgi:hypothetical protein